jgi:hypothetical protein
LRTAPPEHLSRLDTWTNPDQSPYIAHQDERNEAIKAIALLGGAGVAVLAAVSAKAFAALQANVAALQKRNTDLALKGRIVSSQLLGAKEIHGFGLDRFFAEPEFWENSYDAGQVECSKRCIAELTAGRTACEDLADPAERERCFQDALDRATTCHKRCAEAFPRQIP